MLDTTTSKINKVENIKKTVLVTGAGYIGANIAGCLQKNGYTPVVVSRDISQVENFVNDFRCRCIFFHKGENRQCRYIILDYFTKNSPTSCSCPSSLYYVSEDRFVGYTHSNDTYLCCS